MAQLVKKSELSENGAILFLETWIFGTVYCAKE